MAGALLRKLADIQSAERLNALTAMLARRGIRTKVHAHLSGERGFWRVYVRLTDLCCARTIFEALERTEVPRGPVQ